MKFPRLLDLVLFACLPVCLIADDVALPENAVKKTGVPIETEAAQHKAKESKQAAAVELKSVIQPRTLGAYWVYASVLFEEGKEEPFGSNREDVIEVKEIDGVSCYQIKLTLDWRNLIDRLAGAKLTEDDYDYFWEYFDENGSYDCSDWVDDRPPNPNSLKDFNLTLPYPTEKGHTYSFDDEHWEVLETNAAIKTSAGEFNCVVYELSYVEDGVASRERFSLSPGVGLVRWELENKIDGKWQPDMRDDLIKYSLGPKSIDKDKGGKKGAKKPDSKKEEASEKDTLDEA
ncbi:MAG: hypothetical protein AAFX93_13850 [Verrucomicrobiota bacterium]